MKRLTLTILVAVCGASFCVPQAFCHPFHSGVKPRDVADGRLDHPEQIRETLRLFHGHLGPYATLGFRAGRAALDHLDCPKYFGVQVFVEGRVERPFGCFSDGMQVGTGCTAGKGNLNMIPHVPEPGEAPFVVTVRRPDGRAVRISVRPSIPGLFKQWLNSEQTEDETFDELMAMDDDELWTVEMLEPKPLEEYMRIVPDVTTLEPIADGRDGIVRVPAAGDDYTAISFEIPAGHITPPQAGGLTGHAGVTVVAKGKLDLVGMEDGERKRITVKPGSVFVWPKDSFRALGMQNPYGEACHLITVYAPAFPVAPASDEIQEWLEKGTPKSAAEQ